MPSLEQYIARLNAVKNRACTCGYCGADCFDYTPPIPPVEDERGWGLLGLIYYPDCEWLRRRAFQIELAD